MLTNMRNKEFDVVLVYKLDRFTRSVKDLYYLIEEMHSYNVGFRSAQESFDTTTPMGRAMMGMLGIFAQWERETIAERVRDGQEYLARQGKRTGAPLPFGYDKDGTVNEEEKSVLRLLRDMYMDGSGFMVIARRLNEMGKPHRGLAWSPQYVKYCLENPYYAGYYRWGADTKTGKESFVVESDHEPIFSKKEYEQHTDRLKVRSMHSYTKIREYWFAGLLRCGRCDAAMIGRYVKHKRTRTEEYKRMLYSCTRKLQRQGCTLPAFRQELVEKLLMDKIKELKISYSEVAAMAEQEKQEVLSVKDEIERLNKDLKAITERKKKWQYAYAEDIITADELKERTKEDRENETFIRQRIEELEQSQSEVSEVTLNMLYEIPEIWEVLDDREKNELLHTIFESITLDTTVEKVVPRTGQFFPAHIVEMVTK